jgi:hypothetical protein
MYLGNKQLDETITSFIKIKGNEKNYPFITLSKGSATYAAVVSTLDQSQAAAPATKQALVQSSSSTTGGSLISTFLVIIHPFSKFHHHLPHRAVREKQLSLYPSGLSLRYDFMK